ncbi:hypothetical protein QYE76_060580 [Lolium multiflorum]|uniref:Protein kinase domain-containing protein n=1 Tax=Lolium multiflorum TaxID=4521 RepID=A0AAD8S088_LOLMU|nr:hypothetical protein QYE76_060580 [Lolium multiflorum]
MASQLKQLVPYYLLLLSIFYISHAKEKPCKCSDSGQDRRSNHTLEGGDLIFRLVDKESGVVRRVGFDFVRNLSESAYAYNTSVLSTMYSWNLDHANNSLTQLVASDVGSLNITSPYRSTFSGVNDEVSVAIWYPGERMVGVDISIQHTHADAFNYSVWIDYDHVGRGLAVYVELEGKARPKNAITAQNLNISTVTAQYVYFGLVSTAAQLLRTSRGIDFRATVDDLPVYLPEKGGFLTRKMTILFSILGPVTATALMAIALACYFNSRYRRWHRELDMLARSMERLPGVPTKVDFADIKKATCNFRETMKLGGGGFGTVYRCTLPAADSKMDQPMDVAVKRFTRDVQNHRYEDFLTEVSIINRLRHKNIVPLIVCEGNIRKYLENTI